MKKYNVNFYTSICNWFLFDGTRGIKFKLESFKFESIKTRRLFKLKSISTRKQFKFESNKMWNSVYLKALESK